MVLIKIADMWEMPLGQMKAVKIGKKDVLIANVDGKYYAIGNTCAHRGSDLSKGTLAGNIVTCKNHNATFDVPTGKAFSEPKVPLMHPKIGDEPTYSLAIQSNDISIEG